MRSGCGHRRIAQWRLVFATLARALIVCCGLAVPALCAAQRVQASPAPAAAEAQQAAPINPIQAVKGLFERLFSPPGGEGASGTAAVAPQAPDARIPAPPAAAAEVFAPAIVHPVQSEPGPVGEPSPTQPAVDPPPAAAPAPVRSGMALILPARKSAFARAGEIARLGFMAARHAGGDQVQVQLIESDGSAQGARDAYDKAVAANVGVVIGPLTRAEVGGLMTHALPVPTLVLNTPEGTARLPRNLFALSLNIEAEARAAAAAVYLPDAAVAVVVTTATPLSRRAVAGFADAWAGLGGTLKDTIEFAGSLSRVRQGVDQARADVVFLAADAERARLLRPYLGRNTVVIGTSQVYGGAPRGAGKKLHDMNGIRFIDMPWLHQPDHAAAMVFARSEAPLSADLDRLYALGIDAFRVAFELAKARTDFDIDGVTGNLGVHEGLIQRSPMLVEYRDGSAAPLVNRP